ncbi:MAG TPA: hypothetical protein VFJ01_06765 [Oleiagrimonas sp.]|nr:hypothetical protein [Oleiagrimonas sp.]
MIGAVYVVLLLLGLIGFTAHLVAQFRVARILRQRYPHQWDIVSATERTSHRRLHTWARLQRVLRTDIPEMFADRQLTLWHRCWRYAPWVAWSCWLGALALRAATH